MKNLLLPLVTFVCFTGITVVGVGQSVTSFTYQGELKENGNPANGLFNIDFSLWDAEANGNQHGTTISLVGVNVVDGQFTVELDFGAAPLGNSARWLEIEVEGTVLTPRSGITRAPYASQTRGIFVDESATFVGIGREDQVTSAEVFGIFNDIVGFGGMYSETLDGGKPFYGYSTSGSIDAYHFYDDVTSTWRLWAGADRIIVDRNSGMVGIGDTVPGAKLDVLDVGVDATAIMGDSTGSTGVNYGVQGRIASDTFRSAAVYGNALSSSGSTRGGLFLNESSTDGASAVLAQALASSGNTFAVQASVASDGGIAVSGFVPNDKAGTAIRGVANNVNGWAGQFLGRVSMRDHTTVGPVVTQISSQEMFGIHGGEVTGFLGMYISSLNSLACPFYGYSAGGDVDAYTYFDGDDSDWRLWCGVDRISVERSNGNVGIGTTSPNFLLHVNGSAGKPGGGSWSNSSDRRLKKNISDLKGALKKLLQLRGVSFEYTDPESINELPGQRIGVIAQEIEEVFPDWVDERDDGYKTVTFRGFEAIAIEALRELRREKDMQLKQLQVKTDAEIESMRSATETLRAQCDDKITAIRSERDSAISSLRKRMKNSDRGLNRSSSWSNGLHHRLTEQRGGERCGETGSMPRGSNGQYRSIEIRWRR